MTKPPSIDKVTSHDVESNHWMVGLGSNGALVANGDKKSLMKYTFDENQANKVFEKALPDGMAAPCRKYLLSSGQIALRECSGSDPTYLYTANLGTLKTYAGDYGRLIGTLPNDSLVYAKKTSSCHGHEVHIYSADNNHQRVLTLLPSDGKTWSDYLSICVHPTTGHMAVVGRSPSTIDVYNMEGWFCSSCIR